MNCCPSFTFFWRGWSRRESRTELIESSPKLKRGFSLCTVGGGVGVGELLQTCDEKETPSEEKPMYSGDEHDNPHLTDPPDASYDYESPTGTLLEVDQKVYPDPIKCFERESLSSSLELTEKRLKEFLKSSDNSEMLSESASTSSSCESLLNGRRLTAADQLIRRFDTRIPVNVLVSYFDEYQASHKKASEDRSCDDEDDAEQELVDLSSEPDSLQERSILPQH